MAPLRSSLRGLPGPLIAALRYTRAALLWMLEPVDWVRRHLMQGGTGPRPPLWIRRHSGPIWAFERAAAEVAATITALGLIRADDHVLDIGCGSGSMAIKFSRVLGPEGRYIGFDVHEPSVTWCRRHFTRDSRFRFDLAPLDTAWSRGGGQAWEYRFPVEDGSVDFVLAKSVFTHLLEQDARHYLRELRRVLKPGRSALVTAFLLGDEGLAPPSSETFPYGGPDVWWSIKARPEAAVAYRRSCLLKMARDAALSVDRVIGGSWAGDRTAATLQDVIILS